MSKPPLALQEADALMQKQIDRGVTHCLLFSHGLGASWDDGGLLTNIASWFPDIASCYVPLTDTSPSGETVVLPLTEQRSRLSVRAQQLVNDGLEVTVICHSMGCVAAASEAIHLADQAILLTPPMDANPQRLIERFMQRPDTIINLDGISRLARSSGARTLVDAAHFRELRACNPAKLYRGWADRADLTIIEAGNDDVLGAASDTSGLDGVIDRVVIEGADHSFSGHRDQLRAYLLNLIQ